MSAEVQVRAQGFHLVLFGSAPGEIHSVFHYTDTVTVGFDVAQVKEVLARAFADSPDLVCG